LYTKVSHWRHFENCALLCMFLPWRHDEIADLVKGVTGWEVDVPALLKIGERAMTLSHIFNLREGFHTSGDHLPKRFNEPLESGPIKGVSLDAEELQNAKELFYEMVDWDKQGRPTQARLEGLGIEWTEPYLQRT